MSLFGVMRTSTSGMNVQASRLSTVADNVANGSTTGYKRASTEFSTMVLPSGGVQSNVRYSVSQQGALAYTTSSTDIALQGTGMFIVKDAAGTPFLTRAGSFSADADGNLVNAAGYTLMGYDYNTGTPAPVVNGFEGLVAINIGQSGLTNEPTTKGVFAANLPSTDTITAAADLPSANAATAVVTQKNSLVTYDNLGNQVLFDFYYSKTADNVWEVAVYNKADATGTTGFPYSSGPIATQTLSFDVNNQGALLSTSADSISFAVPNGSTVTMDFSDMTQKASGFVVQEASVDGKAPSLLDKVEISKDGTVTAVYKNGSLSNMYRIALATVASPDKLTPLAGNVYQQGNDSGIVTTGFAGNGNFGEIISGALESSNVDLAAELTLMIEAQRSYTANSKVFQTGGDLMDVLVNLKR
jgi:flagellar hook protein FlgE